MRASKLRVTSKGFIAKWHLGRFTYETVILFRQCPKCGAVSTIAALPSPLLKQQTDGTTHACVPQLGGCDWGFAYTPSPLDS